MIPVVNPVKTWYESVETGLRYVSPLPTYNSLKSLDNYLKNYSKYFRTLFPNPLKKNKIKYLLSQINGDNVLEINTLSPFLKKEHISIYNMEYVEDRIYKYTFDTIVFFNPEYSRILLKDLEYLISISNNLFVFFNLNENIFQKDPRALWYLSSSNIAKFIKYTKPFSFDFIDDELLLVQYKK
ncbi:hypothetical protein [Marinitoga lauensis]|uniref:hypothetical protein n=1 Tax=Marinitoga lauensis TaxID=2201189 RepID=UPI001012E44F|nr:hypothetical protein [Marinitoga lauensis]